MVVKANMGGNWLWGLMILKSQLNQMFSVAIGMNGSNLSFGKETWFLYISVINLWSIIYWLWTLCFRFQGTTDAMAAQFFIKNIHSQMRIAAFNLFGDPQVLGSQPNVFGELMRVLISPTKDVEAAVNWVIGGEENPDISLHMRMLMNR